MTNNVPPSSGKTLVERKQVAESLLRYCQFNVLHHEMLLWIRMARHYLFMLRHLPARYAAVEKQFEEASGMTLSRYYEGLALVLASVTQESAQWMTLATATSKIKHNAKDVERILRSWTTAPEEYANRVSKWKAATRWAHSDDFDFVPLRETPFIEGRQGQIVCPNVPFLFAKISDGPFFILSNHLSDFGEFHKQLGLAYQDYANALVRRIACADRDGEWQVYSGRGKNTRELADICIVRGSDVVIFEHKGGRVNTEFLIGGAGSRVLGPNRELMDRLDQGGTVSYSEGLDADEGLLTKPLWQRSNTLTELLERLESDLQISRQSARVSSIITYQADIRVYDIIRKAYLNPLLDKAQLNEGFFDTQWLHVQDLEQLAAMAERGELSLVDLLVAKHRTSPDEEFGRFLLTRNRGFVIIDPILDKTLDQLLGSAGQAFFRKPMC